eukprot:1147562-Pelagomonas_calceolata.AAC.2
MQTWSPTHTHVSLPALLLHLHVAWTAATAPCHRCLRLLLLLLLSICWAHRVCAPLLTPAGDLDRSNSALTPVPPPAAAAAVSLLGSQSVCTVAHTCRWLGPQQQRAAAGASARSCCWHSGHTLPQATEKQRWRGLG